MMSHARVDGRDVRVMVCVLGSFRVLRSGDRISLRPGGKGEQLLRALALGSRGGVDRYELLHEIWPTSDGALAAQSLSTLVYWLHRALGAGLNGRAPVLHDAGRYRLNVEDGVRTDVALFDLAAAEGDRATREGDHAGACHAYEAAIALYTGDLTVGSHIQHVVERERLRTRCLSLRARLADQHFAAGDYGATLDDALQLLLLDPCREDAHRLAMRCYVRLGERAQALRQYHVCREVLDLEFSAVPEAATDELYEAVRLEPSSV